MHIILVRFAKLKPRQTKNWISDGHVTVGKTAISYVFNKL